MKALEVESRILLAHGGGGRLTRDLIATEIVPRFGDGPLRGLPDAACLPVEAGEMVFTTDGFVVQPLCFPGGNIGDLAVHGSVNDVAVSGGCPLWLSLALIIEEGLPLHTLRTVLNSVKSAAEACGVTVATGDTKVVERGQCDGLFITTTALGRRLPGFRIAAANARAGDRVLVSGGLAEHGMAVMCARKNIGIEQGPLSDSAPVHRLVAALAPLAQSVAWMRDPTRGGLASVLNELVDAASVGVSLREADLPLSAGVRAVADMLGLDPLHVASEGRVVLVCRPEAADEALQRWRALPEGAGACEIGRVVAGPTRVTMETTVGGRRLVDMPRGELLPRIC